MKRKNITAVLLVMCLFVLAGYAHRAYLEKVFIKKYSDVEKSDSSAGDDASDLQKQIESLESKNKVLEGLNKDKNRQIEDLQSRLSKADSLIEYGAEGGFADGSGSGSENMSFANSSRAEMADRLSAFAEHISQYMDEEQAEAFLTAFNEFVEDLNIDKSSIPVAERKENLLNKLQEQLAGSKSEYHKKMLQSRIDAINNASEEDLPGILSYYQRMDDIQNLNKLMREFNIGRDELIAAGIDPPPRSQMGPDPLELAVNLDSFAEAYSSLIPQDRKEQFTEQISEYLDDLTSWKSRSELEKYKKSWYNKTEKEYQKRLNDVAADTNMSEEKRAKRVEQLNKYYERRLQGIEKSSDSKVRSMIQYHQMGELRDMLREYDIPSSDLRQYGVITYGYHGHWGRGRR